MKLKFKIGVVGAIAVLLVALGAFGFSRPNAKADIVSANNASCPLRSAGVTVQDVLGNTSGPCVYLVSQHFIPATLPTGGFNPTAPQRADRSCANAPGATSVTQANFPQSTTTFFYSTGTTTAQPTGLPLVEINNQSAVNSVLNVTQPSTSALFVNNNFVYICVNPSMATCANSTLGCNLGVLNTNAASILLPTGTTAGTGIATNDGDIMFSANGQAQNGYFDMASCGQNGGGGDVAEWTSDRCFATLGEGTSNLTIPGLTVNNDMSAIIVRFGCVYYPLATGLVFPITITQDAGTFTFNAICKGEASATATTISATPNTVEIIPARSNTSHSLILVKALDANGNPSQPGRDVDFRTDRCAIETAGLGIGTTLSTGTAVLGGYVTNIPTLGTLNDGPTVLSLGSAINLTSALNTAAPGTYLNWEYSAVAQTPIDVVGGFAPYGTSAFSPQQDLGKTIDGFDLNTNGVPDQSLAGAVLSCNPVQAPGTTPGTANISACVQVINALDVCVNTTVKVIGPPASITVAASPTSLICGEKSTITATVVDSVGQNVSDHTRVELVTNLGGVIGGTGAVAGFAANVAPVSSSVADTFGGVATGFLLTSDVTRGPYEVVATSGGTTSGDFAVTGSFPNGTQTIFPQTYTGTQQIVNSTTAGQTYTVNGQTFTTVAGQVVGPYIGVPDPTFLANTVSVPANSLAGVPLNGGTGFAYANTGSFGSQGISVPVTQTYLGGQFSTPPVSAQVTVNCSLPATPAPPAAAAPAVTAPRTGTGIVPPNTGDAGLLSSEILP